MHCCKVHGVGNLVPDLLHWLRAHGCDPDGAPDRAQAHFEAELTGAA